MMDRDHLKDPTRRRLLTAATYGAGLAILNPGGAVSFLGEALAEPGGEDEIATFAFLTDTHVDMKCSQANLEALSHWLVENAGKLNLRYVAHQGDVGDRRGSGDIGQMLHASRRGLAPIIASGLPLSVAIGNHDYDEGSHSRPCTQFNRDDAFGREFYGDRAWFGGTFEEEADDAGVDPGGTVNHYVRQEIAGRKFLFLTIELYPREKVMRWFDHLVRQRYADHEVLVTTHAYLHRTGELQSGGVGYDAFSREQGTGEYSHTGEEMWDRYFRKWKNLRLVTGGHFINSPKQAYLRQVGEHGNVVHTHFWNYQNWGFQDGELYRVPGAREGEHQAAVVRLLQLRPAEDSAQIRNHMPSAGVEGHAAEPDAHAFGDKA